MRRGGFGAGLLLGAGYWVMAAAVLADVSIPTVTKVYFERDRRPVHTQVELTVRCTTRWAKAG